MIDQIATAIKLVLVPGSLPFLLLGLTVGVLFLLGPARLRRLAVFELGSIALLYWLLSVPAVANLLANRIHASPALTSQAALADADAIVVLGAGVVTHTLHGFQASVPDRQTIFNAFEGARLYQRIGRRVPVVASGGVVSLEWQREPESVIIRELLVRAGVPAAAIILDSESKTTHEQAVNLAPLIRQRGWQHVVVVAPAVQMPRAVQAFAKEGVAVTPAEAPFRSDSEAGDAPSAWLPSADALAVSARASYDYLAWFYYWMRGWLT